MYFYKKLVPFKKAALKQYYFFLILGFFTSCQYFEKQVPSEKELLQKELKAQVDIDDVKERLKTNFEIVFDAELY